MTDDTDDTAPDPYVQQIRDELDRRAWSQRRLADKALLGEATVFRLLKGDYSNKTLRKVERALGITLKDDTSHGVEVADIQVGGYAKQLYDYYEGDYICVKPAFKDETQYYTYQMTITWSDDKHCLVFEDKNPQYEQTGSILVSQGTQFLHFLTCDQGSARLITAYHMPRSRSTIRGISLTLANPRGRVLYPAAYPIVMKRITDTTAFWRGLHGFVDKSDPRMEVFADDFKEMALSPMLLTAYL